MIPWTCKVLVSLHNKVVTRMYLNATQIYNKLTENMGLPFHRLFICKRIRFD